MSYKRLKQKVIMLNESELHFCEVLKNVYKINPSQFIRQAFVEKLEKDMPTIRKQFAEKHKNLPF